MGDGDGDWHAPMQAPEQPGWSFTDSLTAPQPMDLSQGGPDWMSPADAGVRQSDPALVDRCVQLFGSYGGECDAAPIEPDDLNTGMSEHIDGPTYAPSALGDYVMVPDGSPDMPANGIEQSRYERELAVYDGVANGSSHIKIPHGISPGDLMHKPSLSVDDSPENVARVTASKEQFRASMLDDMRTLVQIPTGLDVAEELDLGGPNRDHDTTILAGPRSMAEPAQGCNRENERRPDGKPGAGCGSEVFMSLTQDSRSIEDRDATGTPLPHAQSMRLGHELIHSLHNLLGISEPDDPAFDAEVAASNDPTLEPRDINFAEEFATVGLGTNVGTVTEDEIRSELCLKPRESYSGFKP